MHQPLTSRLVARGGRLFTLWSDGTQLPVVRGGDGEPTPLADLVAQAQAINADTPDDQLAQLDADITAAAQAVDPANVDDATLATLQAANEAVQGIRAEAERREADAERRADEARAALAAITGEQAEPDGEGGGDGEGAEQEGAEGQEGTQPEPEPEGGQAGEQEGAQAADTAQPIAASGAPARRRPPITRVATRRPTDVAPRPSVTAGAGDGLAGLGLVASANAPGVPAGSPITNYDQLARVFVSGYEAMRGFRQGAKAKVALVQVGDPDHDGRNYPEGYRLDGNLPENLRKIAAAQRAAERGGIRAAAERQGDSLAAAGGICAPQQVRYDLPVVGDDARPLRDEFMARFGADRGGIRTIDPPSLDDVDDAISLWTHTNDLNPGVDPDGAGPLVAGPATKPCLTVSCPGETESLVDAIVRCLRTGNFRVRFFPEQIEAWMRLVTVAQARFAERQLLGKVSGKAGTVNMTQAQVLSSGRDMLTTLDRIIARWRNVYRLEDSFTLQFAAPRWFLDQVRADIARQLPVGSLAETLAVAQAEIESFFRTRNVDPVWLREGEAGQDFAAQASGVVAAWPATVKAYITAPGAWLFLDGGGLDLGMMRDTTNTATNDVQFFAETWEGAHFHSPLPNETLTLTSCPDGSVSATTAVDTCV